MILDRGRLDVVLSCLLFHLNSFSVACECSWTSCSTSTMTDSFTLPLRPILEKSDVPDTLPLEIAQINSQWGSFRDVNEEVLRSKIAEEDAREGAPPEEEEEREASDLDSKERIEQLYKRRADIHQFAMSVIICYG